MPSTRRTQAATSDTGGITRDEAIALINQLAPSLADKQIKANVPPLITAHAKIADVHHTPPQFDNFVTFDFLARQGYQTATQVLGYISGHARQPNIHHTPPVVPSASLPQTRGITQPVQETVGGNWVTLIDWDFSQTGNWLVIIDASVSSGTSADGLVLDLVFPSGGKLLKFGGWASLAGAKQLTVYGIVTPTVAGRVTLRARRSGGGTRNISVRDAHIVAVQTDSAAIDMPKPSQWRRFLDWLDYRIRG